MSKTLDELKAQLDATIVRAADTKSAAILAQLSRPTSRARYRPLQD
jgi:hypothetical protein